MAGHSAKKEKTDKSGLNSMNMTVILIVTGIFTVLKLYKIFLTEEGLSYGDIISFIYFTTVNYILFRLIDITYKTMWYLPLYDLLILTLLTQVLINFHWKFWFIYLLIPAWGVYKGALWMYEYVRDLNNPVDPSEGGEGQPGKQKPQTKYVKVK
jgi:hypothetical protein